MNFKVTLLELAILALISIPIARLAHTNYWLVFFIAIGALLLNGWLAQWEDNQPGGFNNPKNPKNPT